MTRTKRRTTRYTERTVRRRLNLQTALSLLLWMAVCALWAWSYRWNWPGDEFRFTISRHPWQVQSHDGVLSLHEGWVRQYNAHDVRHAPGG